LYTTVTELIGEWNREAMLTQKVMDALTDASLQQQVSPEGRTLGRLAWHIVANTPAYLTHFGITAEAVKDPDTVPGSARAIAEGWREVSARAAEAVQQQWTDESLKQVQNAFGRELSNAAILLLLVKHHAHHRGQMTVLMRQAGLKVPGVYGPAREEWSGIGGEPPRV
jgi:uncharacterized damage-inducible protein DinB